MHDVRTQSCCWQCHTVVSLSTCINSTDWAGCQEDVVDPDGSRSISSVGTRRGPTSPAPRPLFFLPNFLLLFWVLIRWTVATHRKIVKATTLAAPTPSVVYIPPGIYAKKLLPTPQCDSSSSNPEGQFARPSHQRLALMHAFSSGQRCGQSQSVGSDDDTESLSLPT